VLYVGASWLGVRCASCPLHRLLGCATTCYHAATILSRIRRRKASDA
jgi:hypothetical protein